MTMSVQQMIFLGLPEGITLAIFAFVLSKLKIEWLKIIIIGSILPVVTFFLRLLPITFGVHTIVSIGVLFFLLIILGRINLVSAVTNSIITFLFLIIFETICSAIIMNLFNLSLDTVKNNVFINMAVAYPHNILLLLTAYLIKIKRG